MPYIPPGVVEKAREMDLLTYLKSYEPQELVHFGGNTYCTREHDSLKISNGTTAPAKLHKSGLFLPLLRNRGHEKSGVPVLPYRDLRNAACAMRYSIFLF